MALSDAVLDAMLNEYFRADQTPPANVYVALNRVLPNQAGSGGTEVPNAGSYARVGVARGGWSAPAAGTGAKRQIANSATVNFGTPSADWAPSGSEVVGFTLWTAQAYGTGTYLGKGTLPSTVIQSGNPVTFEAGALKVTAAPGT